jgi:hypothetical protein
MNGWEEGVLEKAVSENDGCKCGCGCGQEQMEQCFGADNVNKDSDESWKSCSATGNSRISYDSEVLDVLPGCNPIQYGPASATPATGAGCNAAPSTPAAGKSTQVSSTVASQTSAASVSSPADYKTTSKASPAMPEATDSQYAPVIPNKGVDKDSGDYQAAQPTSVAASSSQAPASKAPIPSPAGPAVPADQTSSPVAGGDNDEDCKPPVTVTYTPTVYVTASAAYVADATTCAAGPTVYKTLTETVTVMAPATKETPPPTY